MRARGLALLFVLARLVHAALRFGVGDRVECHMGEEDWRKGTVAKLEVDNGDAVAPYLVTLDSGEQVVAPRDDDRFIRKEGFITSAVPARLLRFAVGSRVECNLGRFWGLGTVTAINYHEPQFGEGVTMPYQVQLDKAYGARMIYAPNDEDEVIRRADTLRTSDPSLRFSVGDRIECFLDYTGSGRKQWEAGIVVALHYHEDSFGPGVTVPYQVQLARGEDALIFIPQDLETHVRALAEGASSPPAAASTAGTRASDGRRAAEQIPSRRSGGEGLSTTTGRRRDVVGDKAARGSRISQRRVGRRASTIGLSHPGSKLGTSKIGHRPARARAGKSAAKPEAPEAARSTEQQDLGGQLERWRTATERPAR